MALTDTQKQWAFGGGLVLLVGYGLLHGGSRDQHALPSGGSSGHARRRKRRPDPGQEVENGRGEYGGRKKHHHRRHSHD